jgi:hypothetical protein
MARKHPELTPVTVEKMRYGFTVDGIICEYAQVWFNGALVETACAESENYAGMKRSSRASASRNAQHQLPARGEARGRHGVNGPGPRGAAPSRGGLRTTRTRRWA